MVGAIVVNFVNSVTFILSALFLNLGNREITDMNVKLTCLMEEDN